MKTPPPLVDLVLSLIEVGDVYRLSASGVRVLEAAFAAYLASPDATRDALEPVVCLAYTLEQRGHQEAAFAVMDALCRQPELRLLLPELTQLTKKKTRPAWTAGSKARALPAAFGASRPSGGLDLTLHLPMRG